MAKKKQFRLSKEQNVWDDEGDYGIELSRRTDCGDWVWSCDVVGFEDGKVEVDGDPGKAIIAGLRACQQAGILAIDKNLPTPAKSWLRRHKIAVPE